MDWAPAAKTAPKAGTKGRHEQAAQKLAALHSFLGFFTAVLHHHVLAAMHASWRRGARLARRQHARSRNGGHHTGAIGAGATWFDEMGLGLLARISAFCSTDSSSVRMPDSFKLASSLSCSTYDNRQATGNRQAELGREKTGMLSAFLSVDLEIRPQIKSRLSFST
eukprot:1526602-Prymnesium_polylepis.1